jgi:hypothetical protein
MKMNEIQYKNMLKKEIKKFFCVEFVYVLNKNQFYIQKSNNSIDKDDFVLYLEENQDKYKILSEDKIKIIVEILNLEQYKQPKTELDIKIEELEKQLKKLKEKRKIQKLEQIKENKILKLKEELRKLEEN